MASLITVLEGESGTGKTSSIETLDPETTLILNTERKRLPFQKQFPFCLEPHPDEVIDVIRFFRNDPSKEMSEFEKSLMSVFKSKGMENRKQIRVLVIDSLSKYLDLKIFNIRQQLTGYEVWQFYADQITTLFLELVNLTTPYIFLIGHTETVMDSDGNSVRRIKVKGKEWEGKIEYESTCNFFSTVKFEKGIAEYQFMTNRDAGNRPAKSPREMFNQFIPNSLGDVVKRFDEFYNITKQEITEN